MARLDYLALPDGKYLLVLDQLDAESASRLRLEIVAKVDAYLQEHDMKCLGILVFNIVVDIGE
jgi:hypothetical protein